MKNKLALPGLALTAFLTACPGTPTPDPTYALTVKLEGLSSAPVRVTNTATGAVIFNDTLTSGKTFAALPASAALKVEGQEVSGYITPAAQTATLTADQTVTLTYTRAPLTRIAGTVRLSLGQNGYAFPDAAAQDKTLHLYKSDMGQVKLDLATTVDRQLRFTLDLPTAAQIDAHLSAVGNTPPPATCQVRTFQVSDPTARISSMGDMMYGAFVLDAPELTISGRVNLRPVENTADLSALELVYADRPVIMKVDVSCPFGPQNIMVPFVNDLQFQKGWNVVRNTSVKYGEMKAEFRSVNVDTSALVLIP